MPNSIPTALLASVTLPLLSKSTNAWNTFSPTNAESVVAGILTRAVARPVLSSVPLKSENSFVFANATLADWLHALQEGEAAVERWKRLADVNVRSRQCVATRAEAKIAEDRDQHFRDLDLEPVPAEVVEEDPDLPAALGLRNSEKPGTLGSDRAAAWALDGFPTAFCGELRELARSSVARPSAVRAGWL